MLSVGWVSTVAPACALAELKTGLNVTGRVFTPLVRLAGKAQVRASCALGPPLKTKVPAEALVSGSIVRAVPGMTVPKSRLLLEVRLSGPATIAVAVMVACAC